MKNKLSPELHKNIEQRLQRLEGQIRGVRRMMDEDRECQDILTQLSAIRGAAYQISLILVENYALDCVSHPEAHGSTDEAIAKMVNTLGKLT
ncbi:MAG: metal-sensitive transcriptional regulator [Anaerolineae bacterium]|nr:metal-sensitive transcriptional regulator [Anaerolineae bacterium]